MSEKNIKSSRFMNRRTMFVLFLVMSIVWMAVIFEFSSKNADESTAQSNSVTDFLMMLFEEDYETLTQEEKQLLVEKYDGIVRTGAHFGVFGVLGLLTYFTFGILKWIPDCFVMPSFMSVPFCILFSITDEIHQSFVPGRSCQLKDVVTDSFGALCGALAGIILVLIVKTVSERKANKS